MVYAIHLCARNDINGNPRRVFILFDASGNYLGSVDEGYRGRHALLELTSKPVQLLARIDITPSFYRRALKGAF